MPHRLLLSDPLALAAAGMACVGAIGAYAADPRVGGPFAAAITLAMSVSALAAFLYRRYHRARNEARVLRARADADVAEARLKVAQAETAARIARLRAQEEWERVNGPSLTAKIDQLAMDLRASRERNHAYRNEVNGLLLEMGADAQGLRLKLKALDHKYAETQTEVRAVINQALPPEVPPLTPVAPEPDSEFEFPKQGAVAPPAPPSDAGGPARCS